MLQLGEQILQVLGSHLSSKKLQVFIMCKGLNLLQFLQLSYKLDSVEGILENLEHNCE